jgi:hypothetical protein
MSKSMASLELHPSVKRFRRRQSDQQSEPVSPLDSDWLRGIVLAAGAEDVGLAEIDRE